MFQLRRQPRKPGSGRQRRPLTLPLTSALGATGAGIKRRSRLRASTKHALTTATDDAGPPAVGTASALGLHPPAQPPTQSPVVRAKKQRVAEIPKQKPATAAAANSPVAALAPAAAHGETVVHAFDPTEGRQHRVLVMGFSQGSRRRAQPRTFTLSFKVPPPPRYPTPAPSPVPSAAPSPLATASRLATPARSPAATVSLSPLTGMRGRISAAASPGVREPHLDDLVALAFEAAHAAEARKQAEMQRPSVSAAATPAPGRLPAGPAPGLLTQDTPARLHATPIEGVPERLLLPPLTSDRRRRFGNLEVRSTPAAGQQVPGTSVKGFTPIEGVPERMPDRSVKRMRLSAPFARHLPPVPPSLQQERGDGQAAGKDVPEPSERAVPENNGTGQKAASPSGATSQLDNLAQLQPAEIAAAVSAVARAALERGCHPARQRAAGPAAAQHLMEAADGQAGMEDIIHRAPAGAVRSAGMVTPTLVAATAAAAAAVGSTSSPALEERVGSGEQAGPSRPSGAQAAGIAAAKAAPVAVAVSSASAKANGTSQQAQAAAGAVDDAMEAGWQEDAANDLGMDEDMEYDDQEEAEAGAERQEDEQDADAAQEVLALPEEPAARGSSAEQRSAGSSGARASGSSSGERNHSSGAEGEAAARSGSAAHSLRHSVEEHVKERRFLQGRKSLAGNGLTVDEGGTRRSTRSRVRPLQYWRGEAKTYNRAHNTLPTIKAIKMRTPEPKWPRPTSAHEKAKRKARTKQAAGLDAEAQEA
eukprot:XP_001701669.1 predicted protein [Chlamydomonas reinhardtii]